jgi:hypothetical protein
MFKITNEAGYTKIVVNGKLTHADYIDTLIPKFEEISKSSYIKIMMVMNGFEGIELKAMLDDLKPACKYRKDFEKVAVVTHSTWMKISLNIFAAIISGEVKTFENEQDAEQWLA